MCLYTHPFNVLQMDAKFLRNQKFAKKHNLKHDAQIKRFQKRKAEGAQKK